METDWRALLDFEATAHRNPAAKARAIRETFDLSPARYHTALMVIIDSPDALLYAPTLVARLQRLREQGRRTRFPAA